MLRNLPSIEEVLNDSALVPVFEHFARTWVTEAVRDATEYTRKRLIDTGVKESREVLRVQIVDRAVKRLYRLRAGSLQRVINATGVVLHTNLGRAVLTPEITAHMASMTSGYTNLEFDLEKGSRGSRYTHIEPMLSFLTGCEAAIVVNNNAAAVLLALSTLAKGREVIVSRGQLVEIGGSFRIPEIMQLSGASMVEVGTTNKTHPEDYTRAISEQTALLLGVHTSNYRIMGFTESVSLEQMVNIGTEARLPVMLDLGSGTLTELTAYGLEPEPTVKQCLAQGVDVLTFSGDKLLGGPQAGIIAGRKEYIDQIKKNQLLRALRVDKMTIAALEATLARYMSPEPLKDIPVLSMLTVEEAALKSQAKRLTRMIAKEIAAAGLPCKTRAVPVIDQVGGGAYPMEELPGWGVEIAGDFKPDQASMLMRNGTPAVLVRIQDDALLLSVRTLFPWDEQVLPELIRRSLEGNRT